MFKNTIFDSTKDDVYKISCNLARRIAELFILDCSYSKGIPNL